MDYSIVKGKILYEVSSPYIAMQVTHLNVKTQECDEGKTTFMNLHHLILQ